MIQGAMSGVKKAYEECGNKTNVLGVSVLTSMSQTELEREMNVGESIENQVNHLVNLGVEAGISGIVCSPLETKVIRTTAGEDIIIVNPGVRMKEDAAGDQTRIAEPKDAIAAGATHVVMGRPIYKASNPAKKLAEVLDTLKN